MHYFVHLDRYWTIENRGTRYLASLHGSSGIFPFLPFLNNVYSSRCTIGAITFLIFFMFRWIVPFWPLSQFWRPRDTWRGSLTSWSRISRMENVSGHCGHIISEDGVSLLLISGRVALWMPTEKVLFVFRLDHLIKAHLEKLCSDKKATAEFKVRYVTVCTGAYTLV
jgi:hypothetical protein